MTALPSSSSPGLAPCGPAPTRPRVIALLAAEAIKLRRSSVWIVSLLLPVLAVVAGGVNYVLNVGVLTPGWASYSSQVLLFYALFFCSLGVALLASSAWRPEHRTTSWDIAVTSPAGPVALALAKTVVLTVPLAAMQGLLLVLTWVVGAGLGLGMLPPAAPVGGCLIVLISAQPLIAVQSTLSMRMRSFAAPVAVCFVAVVVSLSLVMQDSPLANLWPPSLVTQTLTLGSSATLSNAGSLDAASLIPVLLGSLGSGAVCWILLALAARRGMPG